MQASQHAMEALDGTEVASEEGLCGSLLIGSARGRMQHLCQDSAVSQPVEAVEQEAIWQRQHVYLVHRRLVAQGGDAALPRLHPLENGCCRREPC